MLNPNWSVKSRLSLLIAVFIVGIIILFYQGITALRSVENAAGLMGDGKDIVADILPPPLYLVETQLIANEVLQAPVSERKALAAHFLHLRKDYDTRNAYWLGKTSEVDQTVLKSLLGTQKEKGIAYWEVLEKRFLPPVLAGDDIQARRVLDELKVLYSDHRNGVDGTVKLAGAWADTGLAKLGSTVKQSNYVFSIVALISITAGIIIAVLTMRAIVIPLRSLQKTIGEVEHTSDFTITIQNGSHDEVGETAHSINQLLSTTRKALHQIQDGFARITDASYQLSSASKQLAASSAQQSESATAMAATVEQVTTSIRHISDNARDAENASRKSGDLSREGGAVILNAADEMTNIADTVRQASASIEALGHQSTQISAVVQVIKEVAEQTNLLALNAAIEAARAGEQGRGFAVVADEVRKLAERTSLATEEIAGMISAIQGSATQAVATMSAAVEKAGGGVVLAEQAGNAIKKIEGGANHVIALVNDISLSLSEETLASNDIAQHVERVARMTEENNSAASSTANAAARLEQLADQMQHVVGRFRI